MLKPTVPQRFDLKTETRFKDYVEFSVRPSVWFLSCRIRTFVAVPHWKFHHLRMMWRARVALGLELLKVSGRERGLISPLPLRGFQPLEEQSVSFRVLSVFAFPLRLTQKGRFSPAKQFKGEDWVVYFSSPNIETESKLVPHFQLVIGSGPRSRIILGADVLSRKYRIS